MATATKSDSLTIQTKVWSRERDRSFKTKAAGEEHTVLTVNGSLGSKKKQDGSYPENTRLTLVFWDDVAEAFASSVQNGETIRVTSGYLQTIADDYATNKRRDNILAILNAPELEEEIFAQLTKACEQTQIQVTVNDFVKV